jgi:hypothetical protein
MKHVTAQDDEVVLCVIGFIMATLEYSLIRNETITLISVINKTV